MIGGRIGRRTTDPGWAAWLFVAGLAGAASLALPLRGPALACSSVPIAFERIVERAETIVVVDVASRTARAAGPPDYGLVLVGTIRGSHPVEWVGPAPTVTACGDWLAADVGQRLVLALGMVPFDANPIELAAAWPVRADGTVEPTRFVDDHRAWPSVDALAQALGAPGLTPVQFDSRPEGPLGPDPPGILALILVVVAASVVGVGLASVVISAPRRRRSDRR
jgi:hypothetical protein